MRKPLFKYQYEPFDIEHFQEKAAETGAKMEDVTNNDVLMLWQIFKEMSISQAFDWLDLYQKKLEEKTYIIDTDRGFQLLKYKEVQPELIFNKRSLNRVRHLNTLLNRTNEALAPGGYLWCHCRTAVLKKEMIMHKYPPVISHIAFLAHYFWHRVCPKMPVLKNIYFNITGGRHRTYNRVEVLGRMCRAGFQIVDEEFLHGEFFVLGRKVKEPIWNDTPSCGPIIKLRRVAKDGNLIGVYKFRTMYSYSEYIQDYLYRHVGLQDGGKFKNDYRVNIWGKIFRKLWLDELPMILNLFKGQLKLVGVRPLSRQYFSLYSPEMQQLRTKVKPGLIPPFYYDSNTPSGIEEVQESERRYIEAYLEHPFKTDWKYFWGCFRTILIKRKRSA